MTQSIDLLYKNYSKVNIFVLHNQFFFTYQKDMDKDNLLLSFVVIVFWS